MSEATAPSDESDLGLVPFVAQPLRQYPAIAWSDWLDEMQPYVEHYYALLERGRGVPRRTPWEGTFEI